LAAREEDILRLVIYRARILLFPVIACIMLMAAIAISDAYGASRSDNWEPGESHRGGAAQNQRMRIVTGEIEEISGWMIKVRGEHFNTSGAELKDNSGEPFPMDRLAESTLVRLNLWDGEVISVIVIIGDPQ